ncbi:hypothetical protein ACQ4PT_020200 [Festuca glaucescens]
MSDSDVDEDELLQMALQEQAARDLSHQRPGAANKPVVNLVRPPAPSSRGANARGGAAAKARQPSRGGDEDEDSEVEMLSISSGDEDGAPARDRGPLPPRGGGRAGARRAASRDDGDLDDAEPRSWKRVDEAELARRVREMREARAAPSVQAIEQKAVAAQKALTSVQTLPRGVEVLDPLGLGIMDNKSLRLITDASVSSPVSREKSQGLDPSMRDKVIYSSPNFDPKVFLSWVHKDTSAADLESGALTLKTDLKGRTQQKKQLVKENFDCFVSCKTTIDDIESKLRQIEDDPEGAGTTHLYSVTQKISGVANRAFQPLFERQAQAEKIRSVQGMLQRFRTLFNLPSAIRSNIKKGEYDLAVREYQKAKSIVLPSHVGILKRVLEEVENVMHDFRGMLYKSMEDPHLDLAELENIVRLLLELEPETDPVWHYLNIQNGRILGLFEKCTLDHEARMEVLQNKIREKMLSHSKWRQLQQESNKSLEVDSGIGDSFQDDQLSSNFMAEEADSLRASYIRRLTAVLIQHVPAFWRLALSVFSGKFAKAAAGNVLADSDMNTKSGANRTDDKGVEAKYTNHSIDEVASMVHATVSAFDTKVQNNFRDFEECNILRPYMGDTIKEIAKACQTLEGKDSSPTAVKMLHALHFEMTKLYILRLCSWMRATTKEVSKYETWITLSTLERNKSPYAISCLPLEFREITISAMDRIELMIFNLRNESAKYDVSQQLQEIHESVRLAFLNSFRDFAGYLGKFGEELAQSRSNKENNHVQNGYMNGTDREASASVDGDLHKKLLVVLSNIGYCKAELSDELYAKYRHIWSPVRDNDERSADTRDLMTSFSGLEDKVLDQYTFAKSNLIRNAAQNYLLDSGMHWGAAPVVKGIRDATLDLLHILVAVHAEVYSGARPLLEKTMKILVEGLIDIFLSLFYENKANELRMLDANGFCQLMLELEYFETVLHTYFSTEAEQALKSLQENLLEKACESVAEALENPGHNRRPTRGSEDAASDDKQGSSVSPDDLLVLAQQCGSDLLQGELERTRLNIACFMEPTLQSASALAGSKPSSYSSYQAPPPHHPPVQVSSPSFRRQQTSTNSPVVSRRRR